MRRRWDGDGDGDGAVTGQDELIKKADDRPARSGEEVIDVDVGWYGRVGQAPDDLIFVSRLLFLSLSLRLTVCLVSGEA